MVHTQHYSDSQQCSMGLIRFYVIFPYIPHIHTTWNSVSPTEHCCEFEQCRVCKCNNDHVLGMCI